MKLIVSRKRFVYLRGKRVCVCVYIYVREMTSSSWYFDWNMTRRPRIYVSEYIESESPLGLVGYFLPRMFQQQNVINLFIDSIGGGEEERGGKKTDLLLRDFERCARCIGLTFRAHKRKKLETEPLAVEFIRSTYLSDVVYSISHETSSLPYR